jgi:hypothetical protein
MVGCMCTWHTICCQVFVLHGLLSFLDSVARHFPVAPQQKTEAGVSLRGRPLRSKLPSVGALSRLQERSWVLTKAELGCTS